MEYIGWIGWEEIVDIAVEKDGDYTVLNVYFFNNNRELEKTREKRVRTIFKEKDGMQWASIPLLETNRDKDEIKEKVQEYWEKYGQGGEQIGSLEKKAVKKQERLVEENVQNEMDLIGGILEAADSKNYHKLQESIEIKRNGKILFDFNIRSLRQEEISNLMKEYATEKFVLQKIYLATIDKEKIWDNWEIQNGLRKKGFSISTGIDVIQAVLEESEIKEISAKIDKISDFHDFEISE